MDVRKFDGAFFAQTFFELCNAVPLAAQEPSELQRWASGCYFGTAQRRSTFASLEQEQEGLEEALHPKPKEAPKFDVKKLNEQNHRLAPQPVGSLPVGD